MKKQYTTPELTVTTINTTILAASVGTEEIGISNNGVDGVQALSLGDDWGGWSDEEYE